MKTIPLSQGKVALVDDEDFCEVSRFKWYAYTNGRRVYAYRTLNKGKSGRGMQYMHTFLMGKKKGIVIDHINRNGIDNRRSNLRQCTHEQNLLNQGKLGGCTSIYKGVSRVGESKKWIAYINHNKKRYRLGRFDTEEDAAIAYNTASMKFFGEFAYINKI